MNQIQNDYERRVRFNQNKDAFTTFQKAHKSTQSPYRPPHNHPKTEHDHIQSLKTQLKAFGSSMEITKQLSRVQHNQAELKFESLKNEEYRLKLDNLTRNLEVLVNKSHFSTNELQRQKSKTLFEKSQIIGLYQPLRTQQFSRNNPSMQLPVNRNRSFIDKSNTFHCSHSRSLKKHESSVHNVKYNDSSQRKRSVTKKDIVNDAMQSIPAKNLRKVFETYDTLPQTSTKKVQSHKKYATVYHSQAHRHRITSIIIADSIYTSSLDYHVKKLIQKEGEYYFERVFTGRAGIQHIAKVNNTMLLCSRDHYIRSIDYNFSYRFDSYPTSLEEAERNNHANVSLYNHELKLLDLQKKMIVSTISVGHSYTPIHNNSHELYIGTKGALFAVDWRKKQYLINLYKDSSKQNAHWLSDPLTKTLWLQNNNEITVLTPQFRKVGTKAIPPQCLFVDYNWNRNGLYLMSCNEAGGHRLFKYYETKQPEQIDFQYEAGRLCKVVIRQKQLIYGGIDGEIVLKQLKK